jgi:seryl-tRNA synthetase
VTTIRIALPLVTDPALLAELEKQAVYVSPHVRSLGVDRLPDGSTVLAVDCDDAQRAATEDKLRRYVKAMTSSAPPLPTVQLVRTGPEVPAVIDVYAELKQRRWVTELGPGQVALSGPALALAAVLDRCFADLATARFGAAEMAYPVLIPTAVLARCGYFRSFPQSVSVVSHLHEDFDIIEAFRQDNADADDLRVSGGDQFAPAVAALAPSVCYHCYHALEQTRLPEAGSVITAAGHCFRYESKNLTGLDRLWDFTMREIIFVGAEHWVVAMRERAVAAVAALLDRWNFASVFESASDPFFATTLRHAASWQLSQALKYEIRAPIEPTPPNRARTLAVGSFNLHGSFFGRTFDIRLADGSPAFTGCVGFGIERLVLAIFAQHGLSPERWPAPLRIPPVER